MLRFIYYVKGDWKFTNNHVVLKMKNLLKAKKWTILVKSMIKVGMRLIHSHVFVLNYKVFDPSFFFFLVFFFLFLDFFFFLVLLFCNQFFPWQQQQQSQIFGLVRRVMRQKCVNILMHVDMWDKPFIFIGFTVENITQAIYIIFPSRLDKTQTRLKYTQPTYWLFLLSHNILYILFRSDLVSEGGEISILWPTF